MVNLLFIEDDQVLRLPGIGRTLYDPACGTGGCRRYLQAPSSLPSVLAPVLSVPSKLSP